MTVCIFVTQLSKQLTISQSITQREHWFVDRGRVRAGFCQLGYIYSAANSLSNQASNNQLKCANHKNVNC